jgi:3-carboxy-cis,cis-muconate cycloisomerase
MLQEHERSLGGSQAEWPTLAAAVQATGSAVAALSAVMDGLTVNTLKMRSNLDATRGVIFAERAVLMLAPRLGRDRARALVDEALRRTRDSGQAFGDALRAIPEVAGVAPPDELRALDRPEQYLGEAEALRRLLLEESSASVDVA